MSKWHEIREVYLNDIIKKQKMSKGITGESPGEMDGELFQDVYFILDEKNNAVKIGASWFTEKRLPAIQAHNPNKLKIIAEIFRGDEKRLHRRFENLHIHGEWFKYEGELKSFIQELPSFVNRD